MLLESALGKCVQLAIEGFAVEMFGHDVLRAAVLDGPLAAVRYQTILLWLNSIGFAVD